MMEKQTTASTTTTVLLTLIFIGFISLVIHFYLKRRKFVKVIESFNGPQWYPIVGTTWEVIGKDEHGLVEIITQRHKDFGPIYRGWILFTPVLHVMKPEHAEIVFSKSIQKGNFYDLMKSLVGDGLLVSSGQNWKTHRKLITPAFHFQILDNLQPIFSKNAQNLVNHLEKKADGQTFNIWKDVSLCVLDIVTETSMGVQIDALKQAESSEYVNSLHGWADLTSHRLFRFYQQNDFFYFNFTKTGQQCRKYIDFLNKFNFNVVQKRRESRKNIVQKGSNQEDELLGKKKNIFLDILLEQCSLQNNPLSDKDLRDEVNTFMAAGHDTTTATTCWAILAIASHPEIQAKVQEELDNVFEGEERPVTSEDLNQLQYLERVIKETLRFVSVIPFICRELEEETVLEGRTLPPRTKILIYMLAIHKDPQHWVNPEIFDPDRFLPENSVNRHPYAYIPFAAGPRNCIGQKFSTRSIKTLLAHIFRKFNVSTTQKIETAVSGYTITMKPKGGVQVSLKPRK